MRNKDAIHLLQAEGYDTGIDLVALLQQSLGKKPAGKTSAANDEAEEADEKPAPKRKAPAKPAAKAIEMVVAGEKA